MTADSRTSEQQGKRNTERRPVLTDENEEKRREEEAREKPVDPGVGDTLCCDRIRPPQEGSEVSKLLIRVTPFSRSFTFRFSAADGSQDRASLTCHGRISSHLRGKL